MSQFPDVSKVISVFVKGLGRDSVEVLVDEFVDSFDAQFDKVFHFGVPEIRVQWSLMTLLVNPNMPLRNGP